MHICKKCVHCTQCGDEYWCYANCEEQSCVTGLISPKYCNTVRAARPRTCSDFKAIIPWHKKLFKRRI